MDRRESDQKIERKRGIEKQRTTPKVYSPRVPSTLIWPVGSLPLLSLSLCLSLLPSLTPHSLFFAMPSMNVLPDSRLWERMCHVKAGYCNPTRNGAGDEMELRKPRTGKRTSGASLSFLYNGVIPTEKQIEAMETISVVFILHLLPPPVKVGASRVGLSD